MLSLPSEARSWIKLHRTHLPDNFTDMDYWQDIQKDFEQIRHHVPKGAKTILGIGAGMAGVELLLAKETGARVILLDGDGPASNFRGGYGKEMVPFTSREAANLMFTENGLQKPEWKDVGTKEKLEADLIISLLSWGFHYPLETYDVKGLCIADIRQGQPERGEVIASTLKYNRCKWTA